MSLNPNSKHTFTTSPINHLLVIDDDKITDFVVEGLISHFSDIRKYHFESDGWKALEYLGHCSHIGDFPDLIFLDLKMPLMSGFEFLLRYEHLFQYEYPETKIVIVTNSTGGIEKEIQQYHSVDMLVNKPLDKQKFDYMYNSLFKE